MYKSFLGQNMRLRPEHCFLKTQNTLKMATVVVVEMSGGILNTKPHSIAARKFLYTFDHMFSH